MPVPNKRLVCEEVETNTRPAIIWYFTVDPASSAQAEQ